MSVNIYIYFYERRTIKHLPCAACPLFIYLQIYNKGEGYSRPWLARKYIYFFFNHLLTATAGLKLARKLRNLDQEGKKKPPLLRLKLGRRSEQTKTNLCSYDARDYTSLGKRKSYISFSLAKRPPLSKRERMPLLLRIEKKNNQLLSRTPSNDRSYGWVPIKNKKKNGIAELRVDCSPKVNNLSCAASYSVL